MSRPFFFMVTGERQSDFNDAVRLCLDLGRWDRAGLTDDPGQATFFGHVRPMTEWPEGTPWRYCDETGAAPGVALALYDEFAPKGFPRLPATLKSAAIASLLWSYITDAPIGDAPDTDGSTKRGWELRNSDATGLYNPAPLIVARPVWITYGK